MPARDPLVHELLHSTSPSPVLSPTTDSHRIRGWLLRVPHRLRILQRERTQYGSLRAEN